MKEELKEVAGTGGMYFISPSGNVYSKKKRAIRKLKTTRKSGGYTAVKFYLGDKKKTKSVHRLVAEAFIPNPENKPCVNHIDGVPSNNKVENLEWVTYSENTKHAYTTGLIDTEQKKKVRYSNSLSRDVVIIDRCGNIYSVCYSVSHAAKVLSTDPSSVQNACELGYIVKNLFRCVYLDDFTVRSLEPIKNNYIKAVERSGVVRLFSSISECKEYNPKVSKNGILRAMASNDRSNNYLGIYWERISV